MTGDTPQNWKTPFLCFFFNTLHNKRQDIFECGRFCIKTIIFNYLNYFIIQVVGPQNAGTFYDAKKA